MVVWYLIISLSNGVVALPQVDHKQCTDNRALMNRDHKWSSTYCIPGAKGIVITGSHKDED